MWVVMMVPMMAPSLLPMLGRYRDSVGRTGAMRLGWLTVLVGAGYFCVWAVVGLAAYPVNVLMERAAPNVAGVVVLIASALQFSAWKARQLVGCRERSCERVRPDAIDAWRHGLHLGFLCGRCCINLMVILLAIGVMDFRAMVAVTVAITLERLSPAGVQIARGIGIVALGAGFMLAV
jgi:predicted metal-binding membrane protein